MDISQKILSDLVVFNKYAKHIDEINRREDWVETCERNMAMHIRKFPGLKDAIKAAYREYVIPRKILPSMRSMQFAGAPIELSNSRIFNCSYLAMNHPVAFAEVMHLLLGGSGVGYSVQHRHIDQLPVISGTTGKPRRFLVGDSIEGWADAVKVLIKAYTQKKSDPIFDFRDIRPKGAKLITSGGKAPGPDPLRICIDKLRSILNSAVGRKLTSLEVHDMNCHIADAVLAGGIRRAAMIAGFDHDDLDMLSCKSGTWWELNPQRGRANNSVILKRGEITKEQFDSIWSRVKASGSGEPGFYWTNDLDMFANPCCFVGSTEIKTASGHMSISDIVDSVNSGESVSVMSYNELTGNVEENKVVAGSLTARDAKVITLEFITKSGEVKTVTCTPDHKFLTHNRGWVEARLLDTEDDIVEQS